MVTKNNIIKILLLLSFVVSTTKVIAQKRVALVIGNSDYQEQSLRNPSNDARDVSQTLRDLGFEVDLELNASQEDMEIAVQKFGKKLQGNAVGLFYFSGHGIQYDGSNYLIPIGAMSRVSAPEHLRYKTVDAGYVLGVMRESENGLNIVILDACRNNPFKSFSRSMERGLKRISGAEGTIIAYSTSPGKVALDGNRRNSPYTEKLIKLMKKSNLPVEIMFKQVRKAVKAETGGKQSPWYEASIDGDFYFSKNKYKRSSDGRYIDYNNGTIVDTRTGLMWTKNDSHTELQHGLGWKGSNSYVDKLTTGGNSDWRLPTIKELKGIYDSSKRESNGDKFGQTEGIRKHQHKDVTDRYGIDPIFDTGSAYWFWSSEIAGSCCARVMNFLYGNIGESPRDLSVAWGVRAVRP